MMQIETFGFLPDGREVSLYTFENNNGLRFSVTNYGGIITSLITPDKNGNPGDIVLGYDKLKDYLKNPAYFGAIIGRVANRISGAQFQLDGKTYLLVNNLGNEHLHSIQGIVGKQNKTYQNHQAFCLEAQAFPDAIHHAKFPSNVLRPNQVYRQYTVYQFGNL